MGNRPICFLGDSNDAINYKPQVKKSDSKEDKAMINYIASYKPGRKLVFPNLYYQEGNTLSKIQEKKTLEALEKTFNQEISPDNNRNNDENEEIKEQDMDINTKIIDRDSYQENF